MGARTDWRRRLAEGLNAALAPLGVELRRRGPAGPHRAGATLESCLRCLREARFQPATVIDVGVAEGTAALYDTFPGARHVLVEPLQEFTDDLKRIVAGLPNAEYVLAAAGRRFGTTVLHLGRDLELTSAHTLTNSSLARGEQRTVPVVTLDELWRTRALHGPALLKLDVEGAELEVLAGAETVLAACDYLVVEAAFQQVYAGAPRVEQVIADVARRGFLLTDVVDLGYAADGLLVMADLVFRRGYEGSR